MKKRAQVLVVDDEPEILDTFRVRFRLEGIDVELCDDPYEALLKVQENYPAVVLCDIRMPGMSGVELLRQIKQVHPLCSVIMMTGYSSMAHVVDCLGSGAVDYFVKPFREIDEIIQAVQDALKRAGRWRKAMPLARP